MTPINSEFAASRFEGGLWVRVGFLVTYAAFAYGCVVVGAAVLRLREIQVARPRPAAGIAAAAAIAAIAALGLPAIRFPNETLDGFRGLDILSVLIAVVLALVIAGAVRAAPLDGLRLPSATCLIGVFAGNILIQRYTTRGTSLEYGLWCATAFAAAATVASVAALRVRGHRRSHR